MSGMVSPQKYLSVLIKSITNSQQLWSGLVKNKAEFVLAGTPGQLDSLKKNLQDQLIFLDKVKRHIDFYSQWASSENVENLAFVPIKKYTRTVSSTFNFVQSNIGSLRSLIFLELELLNKTNSSNFSESWPQFLALYEKEKQVLSQIRDSAKINDDALKGLMKALGNIATQAQLPLPARGAIGVVEFGLKMAVAGFAMYLLAPLALPEEAMDTFGGLSNMVVGGAVGIGLVDFFKKATALTIELARR